MDQVPALPQTQPPPPAPPRDDVGSQQLQNVLPAIHAIAQKVGAMKRLAEIVKTLEESKE